MVAESLMTDEMAPLRVTDTGREALTIMNVFSVRHLPIVENEKLLGIISEDDILSNDIDAAVASYQIPLNKSAVLVYDHIYEVMRILAESKLTVIPVVNEKNEYVGLISQDAVLNYFASSGSFAEPGSIVVLSIGKRDYSLAEISRLVESEKGTILSSLITSQPDSQKIDVTLKLSSQNIQNIVATLRRFDYEIKAAYSESDYLDTLQERYDSLMSYLNV